MKDFETRIMKPIIERQDFNKLRKANLIIFDHTMSPDNIYIMNISKMVELADNILVDIKEGYIND